MRFQPPRVRKTMSSPDEALQAAVTALLAKLEAQEQSVRDTKRTINNLLRHIDKPPMFPDAEDPGSLVRANVVTRSDQFYGRALATVVKEILEARGQAMSAQEIIEAMEHGGYDFASHGWKDKDRLRSFTITLSKNVVAFHRLPNGSFGLPKWYPEAMTKKQAVKSEKNAATSEDEATEESDLPLQ